MEIAVAHCRSTAVCARLFGWSVGARALVRILHELEDMGVDHCLLGLKRGSRPADEVLGELIEHVVPEFEATACS